MHLHIRPSRPEDFPLVFPLLCQLWPDKPLDADALEKLYNHQLDQQMYHNTCAVKDNAIVGFCSGYITHSLWCAGKLYYVSALVVDERLRGQNIGGAYLDYLKEYAKAQGCKEIELDSLFHRTRAHSFYEKNGFEKVSYSFSLSL